MNDHHKAESKPSDNQPLSATLMQMSQYEIARLLDTIQALEADLMRLIPLFNGNEPVESVIYTQDLLSVLSDHISQVLAIKQAPDSQKQVQNSGDSGAEVDNASIHYLLSEIQGRKPRLIWTGSYGID
jgi:hypothetical protein